MTTRSIVTTSWDDGHPLDLRVADLLVKYGLTGTFYIPVDDSRQAMSCGGIRQLSETFEVGAHTVHHVVLTDLSQESAEAEIRDSKKRLEDFTGRSCDAFCFPKGRFRRRHLEMVFRAGFRCARTVELLSTRFPARRVGIDVIPTTVQARAHPWSAYAKNCAKRLAARNMMNLILYARARNWTETARVMLRVVAQRGGVFHLWGHSWEVEQHQQWAQLESIFREMREMRATVPCLPNSKIALPTALPCPGFDTTGTEINGTPANERQTYG